MSDDRRGNSLDGTDPPPIPDGMADRPRISCDCGEEFKRAFYAHADLMGLSPQEVFEAWVAEKCGPELAQARKNIAAGEEPPPRPRKRKSPPQ